MLKSYLNKHKTKQPCFWSLTPFRPPSYLSLPISTRFHFPISPLSSLWLTPMGWCPHHCTAVALMKVITDFYLDRTNENCPILILLGFSAASGSFPRHFSVFPSSFLAVWLPPRICPLPSPLLFLSNDLFSIVTNGHYNWFLKCKICSSVTLTKCIHPRLAAWCYELGGAN